jgi:hypothetical protein
MSGLEASITQSAPAVQVTYARTVYAFSDAQQWEFIELTSMAAVGKVGRSESGRIVESGRERRPQRSLDVLMPIDTN